jgi:transposase
VSSSNRTIHRLSRRGTAASTRPSTWPPSPRSASATAPAAPYLDKKLAEGKTRKEALRALKRRISDTIYARLQADARRTAHAKGPGGQQGNDSVASAAGSHPRHRLFGQSTPGPAPTLRPRPAPRPHAKTTPAQKPRRTT